MARIKEKYNPTPSARERAYHLWLIEESLCHCGCGVQAEVVHHPLKRHPHQRWRRDHEYVVPMADHCHRALHAMGSEALFDPGRNYAVAAAEYRETGIDGGMLKARAA